ncbi:MAG TPA: S9 family peptidase [Terracidiphilus sp.]|jgi:dipeptidyl aminopeptidase/acylaminoacyl peptidase|nr:S9 family peptidase [Terracidiphilus sp.]
MNASRFFLCCTLASFLLPTAIAQNAKRPMTFEDMMQMKRLGDTAVSPDGKWLAYSVTTVNLAANTRTPEVWIQAIAGGEPQKLAVGQPGDGGVDFAADGKQILFLSSRDGGQQVWLADLDAATGATSNARRLTHFATEADNAKWSPDGKAIVFTSDVYPDCAPITVADFATGDACNADRDRAAAAGKVKAQLWTGLLYRHWNHFTGEKRSHLFLVDVGSAAVRDLNPGDLHDVPTDYPTDPIGCGCGISPDSKELAFTENVDPVPAISTNSDIFTIDLTVPGAKPVKISTSPGGDLQPAYSPDGKYIAWRSQARAGYESDKFRLVVYDREKKTIKDLLPKFENWVDEFAWMPDSESIYFASGEKGEEPISITNLKGELFLIPSKEEEYSSLHPLQGRSILAVRTKVTSPSEFGVVDYEAAPANCDGDCLGGSAGWRQVTHLNDAILSQLDLPKMQSFWFTAKDGTKLQGFLIPPPGFDPAKKYPVKFLIHGGPQGAWGDSWSYRWNAELFAANGYVVVMINMRGSTGYGQAIVDGVNGDWGGKPFTDLMEGLDYAEQHYPFIDKNRECALGASYGGYMANWILGHTDRFKCIVSHDGMFNAESAFGSTEEDWFNIWEFKGRPWDYYGKPDSENPFRKWSPSLSAKNFKTPTLVVHSQLDYRLDVSEGFQLFDTLQLLGVPSEMLYFPDEGHWVLKPQNSQLWWKTVNAWVDKWTKPGTVGNED